MLFRDSASAVAAESLAGSLFVRLIDQFVHKHGHKPSPSEVRSWERSIPVLTNALLDAGLGMVRALPYFVDTCLLCDQVQVNDARGVLPFIVDGA
ncbi:hypothetical protein ACIQIB_37445, partial [Kitasatospora sp. NPDC092286]